MRRPLPLLGAAAIAASAALAFIPQQALANGCMVNEWDPVTNTYTISTAAQLRTLGSDSRCDMTATVRQVADIDLSGGGEFTPIGSSVMNVPFSGTYEGGGHSITGLQVTSPGANGFGLFGYADGATIRDVSVTGTVIGLSKVSGGLLVGDARRTTISGVTVTGTVRAQSGAGGVAGTVASGALSNSSANVVVTADAGPAGGIAGAIMTVGSPGALVTGVRSEGSVVADTHFAGGIAGALTGMPLTKASSTAIVRGRRAGGLVGRAESDGGDAAIIDSFSTGQVKGAPSGAVSVGGIVGETCAVLAPSLERTYFAGTLEPAGAASGGVVGASIVCPLSIGTRATVTGNLWNSDTVGPAGAGSGVGVSRTTAQMRDISTYTALGWNIANGWEPAGSSTWGICPQVNDGYPYLQGDGAGTACRAPVPVVPITPLSPAALTTTVLISRRRVVSGQSLRIAARTVNGGGTAAQEVTSCLVLPANLVLMRASAAVRSGRTVCFRVGTLAAGAQVTKSLTARAVSLRTVTRRVAGGSKATGMARVAAAPLAITITPRAVRPAVTG